MSQISYRSKIRKLANKVDYPTLFRTSASDESQAQALADIVKHFRWRKVCCCVLSINVRKKYLNSKCIKRTQLPLRVLYE